MLIYLDTNVWNRAFDKPAKRIIKETDAFFGILEMVLKGKLMIVSSVVLDVEVGELPHAEVMRLPASSIFMECTLKKVADN